jgi:hypothetical protein
MLGKTYDALVAAGAPADKAREAAEEIAGFENQLADIKADLRIVKWMIGGIYALGLPCLWLLVRLAAKLGSFS